MSAPRIMLVVNESVVAMKLRGHLENLGYSVVEQVSRGEDAVRLAGQQQPDLVLMDIHLSGQVDVIQAAGQIRALFDTPVIFISTPADAANQKSAQVLGPDIYVINPFEERELDLNISSVLYKHDSERKLRESEQKYRTLFNIMAQGVVYQDAVGNIISVNQAAERILGLSLDQIQGRNSLDLRWRAIREDGSDFPGDQHPAMLALKTGREVSNVVMGVFHPEKDEYAWIHVHSRPQFAAGSSAPAMVVTTFDDITDIKKVEAQLRIKDSAITSSINAIALADLEGRLTYVNPAFLRFWGHVSLDEVLGRSVADFWQEDAPVGEIILALFQGKGWQGELSAKRNDGSTLDVEVLAHLVTDEAGKPLCMMSSFVDISARKWAEAAEREERRLAQALRNSAEALSSTLQLDDVLELILENAGQVIANDSMTIMLLEGQNLKVVRHRGYTERGLKDYIENPALKIDDFQSLRAMVETRQPTIIPDVRSSPDWTEHPKVDWICSYAGAPICKRDEVIGFLNLDSATPNFFTAEHASRLQAFASQAAVAIENARLFEQAHMLSITDGLTGLYCSRHFFDLARLEFDLSRRYLGSLSLVMIDVDHFKRVNDTLGHLAGDDVLCEIARRVRGCLRVVDVAARYGGDEFVILMAQTTQDEACQVAERIRCAVEETAFDGPDGQQMSITISLGVVSLAPEHLNFNMLIKCADGALYSAKSTGKNRVSVWQSQ